MIARSNERKERRRFIVRSIPELIRSVKASVKLA
jgi:hypothetical protein